MVCFAHQNTRRIECAHTHTHTHTLAGSRCTSLVLPIHHAPVLLSAECPAAAAPVPKAAVEIESCFEPLLEMISVIISLVVSISDSTVDDVAPRRKGCGRIGKMVRIKS